MLSIVQFWFLFETKILNSKVCSKTIGTISKILEDLGPIFPLIDTSYALSTAKPSFAELQFFSKVNRYYVNFWLVFTLIIRF